MTEQTVKKKSRLQTVKEIIRPPDPTKRIEDAYGILKEVGGMRPLFNVRDLEQRRKEIGEILTEIQGKTLSEDMEKDVVEKTFKMFFLSGSAWIRGLDNSDLSHAVSSFLSLYKRIGYLPHAPKHLFVCAMNLLHYSFQALDVTNTPAYVISSTPVFTPANVPRVDLSGNRTTPGPEQTAPQPKHEHIQPQ
jgi:hypothetical protein